MNENKEKNNIDLTITTPIVVTHQENNNIEFNYHEEKGRKLTFANISVTKSSNPSNYLYINSSEKPENHLLNLNLLKVENINKFSNPSLQISEIDSNDPTISSILEQNRGNLKKELFEVRKEYEEKGKQTRLDALGITETGVKQAISDFESGKNLNNFYLHKNEDSGKFDVIDRRNGSVLGTALDEKGKGFEDYKVPDILNQTDQSTNLKLVDASEGHISVNANTEYERYKSLYDDIDWNDPKLRKRLIENLQKLDTNKFTIHGIDWKAGIDDNGHKILNLAGNDYDSVERYIQSLSANDKKGLVKDFGDIFKANGAVDLEKLKKRLNKSIKFDLFNKYFNKGGFSYKDFDLSSEENYLKSLSNDDLTKFNPQDLDEINSRSRRQTSLENSYLSNKSIDRELANALVEKYNKEGDSDRLWNSNGILMYRDDFDRVRAYGTVTEDEGGGKFTAKAYSNTEQGAKEFAKHNELINELNESTDAAQASREAFYAMKYGAISLGDGRMYIPLENGTRLVFSALSKKDGGVREKASLDTIKKLSKLYDYDKDSKKESDGLVGYKEVDTSIYMNGIDRKSTAIEEIKQKYDKDKPDEDKKKEIFAKQFNTSLQNIRNARLIEAEKGKGELGETNSILSNIDEQSEQQTNYLRILATKAAQDSGDKNLEKLLSETNKKGNGLSSLATKQAEHKAVTSKEMVNQITAERLEKKQKLDDIVSDLKKEATANPNENEISLVKRVLSAHNSDMTVGQWTVDIVRKARAGAKKATPQSSSPQAPAKTPAKTKEQQKKDKENQKKKEETTNKELANAKTKEKITKTEQKIVDTQIKDINPKLSETVELYRKTGQRIYSGLTNPNSFLGKMINGDSVGFFSPQQTTNNSNTFNAGGTANITNVTINQDGTRTVTYGYDLTADTPTNSSSTKTKR